MTPTTKDEWRSHLRSARLSMDDAVRRRAAVGLASAGVGWVAQLGGSSPGTVCAYVSIGNEPATGLLLEALVQSGHRVFVPVCEPRHQLSWTPWSPGVRMARSALAPVMEPVGPRYSFEDLGGVDGILLPALAVDTAGVRLGQGGGYYDRFLAALASPGDGSARAVEGGPESSGRAVPAAADGGWRTVPTAAVVHEQEVFPPRTLPHDVLDRTVGWVVTPGGWTRADPAVL